MFTDFLVPNQPTTVNETIALYKNVSHYFGNRADGFNGSVPISISLIPIEKVTFTNVLRKLTILHCFSTVQVTKVSLRR